MRLHRSPSSSELQGNPARARQHKWGIGWNPSAPDGAPRQQARTLQLKQRNAHWLSAGGGNEDGCCDNRQCPPGSRPELRTIQRRSSLSLTSGFSYSTNTRSPKRSPSRGISNVLNTKKGSAKSISITADAAGCSEMQRMSLATRTVRPSTTLKCNEPHQPEANADNIKAKTSNSVPRKLKLTSHGVQVKRCKCSGPHLSRCLFKSVRTGSPSSPSQWQVTFP